MDSVALLRQSVEKLLAQVDKLKEQNRELKARNTAAEQRATNAEAKCEELQEQLTSVLLRNTITEVAGGPKAAKLRITRMIRDIDRCLAMSSKQFVFFGRS